jgi:hypothetical protein
VKRKPLFPEEVGYPKSYPLLEWVTAIVLVLVLAALGWMVTGDHLPKSWRLLSLEAEIIGILAVLITALILVSALALLQTQDRTDKLAKTVSRIPAE